MFDSGGALATLHCLSVGDSRGEDPSVATGGLRARNVYVPQAESGAEPQPPTIV